MLDAILAGEADEAETETLPIFNLKMPKNLAGLGGEILDPRSSYDTSEAWEVEAQKLAKLFIDNFKKFTDTDEGKALVKAGPQLD